MGRKERKIVRKADEKEIHKLMKTEKIPKHGADEKSSAERRGPRAEPSRTHAPQQKSIFIRSPRRRGREA
jgi:hypothetical protein